MTNEMTVFNEETGEIKQGEIVVQETADYKVVQLPNGTFKKNMKYHQFASRTPQTDEEEILLYKVFNESDNKLVTEFKKMIDREITIAHVFIKPYQSFDEKTGKVTDGVNTTIEGTDGQYYTTSSKTVYYSLKNILDAFGSPSDPNYTPLKIKVTGTKRDRGVQIDITYLGKKSPLEEEEDPRI